MKVLPLHRWRYESQTADTTKTIPHYGNQSYLTVGNRFVISYDQIHNTGWKVTPNNIDAKFRHAVHQTGLFGGCFPRRKDAVNALVAVLEALQIDGVIE